MKNTYKKGKKYIRVLVLSVGLLASCSTIRAGLYLSSIDPNDIEEVLKKEPEVKYFLNHVYEHPENYTMSAYTRTAIKSDIKKSKKFIHAFYVLNNNEDQYYTLSFNGTHFSRYSQGVWAINTETDLESYVSFLQGGNIWSVEKIETDNEIKVKETIFNVLIKLDSDTRYYYKDHLRNRPHVDNCITALEETLLQN